MAFQDTRPERRRRQEIRKEANRKELLPLTPAWMLSAPCNSADPAIFYPESGQALEASQARGVCARCPLKAACLSYALEHDEPWGIWGGLNREERLAFEAAMDEEMAA